MSVAFMSVAFIVAAFIVAALVATLVAAATLLALLLWQAVRAAIAAALNVRRVFIVGPSQLSRSGNSEPDRCRFLRLFHISAAGGRRTGGPAKAAARIA